MADGPQPTAHSPQPIAHSPQPMNIRSQLVIYNKENRLSRRLLLYVVMCSACFTMLTTAFQLYLEYSRDMATIQENIRFIQDSYVKPVTTSAFKMNEEQVKLQLQGALKLRDIVYLEVSELEADGKSVSWLFEGDPEMERDILAEFPLIYDNAFGNVFHFGTLHVGASLKSLYQRLQEKVLIILASNAVKTFLASLCILIIMQLAVSRHLCDMADYARHLNVDELEHELHLRREISEPDELEQVVRAINEMRIRMKRDITERKEAQRALRKAHDELEMKVVQRTVELVRVNEQLKAEIEERKRIEESLRDSEARLNEAQEIAQIGSYETNFTTSEAYWSDEMYHLLGYEPGEVSPSYELFRDHIHPDVRDEIEKEIQAAYETATPYHLKFRYVRKDGEARIANDIGKVIRDDSSTIAVGTFRDITTQVGTEAELQEKQAQIAHAGRLSSLGEMATGIAHELNQPLSIIRLDAEGMKFALRREGGIGHPLENDLNSVMANVDRAANIIDHMREFARIRIGYSEEINLREPIENSLTFFRQQFRHHEISLETDCEEALPNVFLDSQRFEQVVVNFLSNARYAVDRRKEEETGAYQKKVWLRLFHDKKAHTVVFEIADNGIGMTPEEKHRCMEPFFTTKEVGEGTGLGLSIVRGIIRDFKGRLEVESQKGVGTTMRVSIPTNGSLSL